MLIRALVALGGKVCRRQVFRAHKLAQRPRLCALRGSTSHCNIKQANYNCVIGGESDPIVSAPMA